jgi:hypothetical protein
MSEPIAEPTKIIDSYWVYCEQKIKIILKNVGKWMLFYPKIELDSKWKELCILFNENKLYGILSMKCSTGLKSERSNSDDGVIILYCNNSDNKDEIMNIGKSIIPYIQDYSYKTIYYKTDVQTRSGTVSLGISNNHTYTLNVDKPVVCLLI